MAFENAGENALTLLILIAIFFLIYLRASHSTFAETIEKLKGYFGGD